MVVKFTNGAVSVLASSIGVSDTSILIASADAGKFPSIAAVGDWFPLTLVKPTKEIEIVKVTGRSGATLTVQRAQEGTVAMAFDAGTPATLRMTAALLSEIFLRAQGDHTHLAAQITDLETLLSTRIYEQLPAGAIAFFTSGSPPSNWLKANGALVSRASYPRLWARAQASDPVTEAVWSAGYYGRFSTGDGSTTFRIPDLRGFFPRAWDDSRGIDSGRDLGNLQESQNLSHLHTGTTSASGAHNHGVNDPGHAHGMPGAVPITNPGSAVAMSGTPTSQVVSATAAALTGISLTAAADHQHTVTTSTNGGSEARPRNISLLACIKY